MQVAKLQGKLLPTSTIFSWPRAATPSPAARRAACGSGARAWSHAAPPGALHQQQDHGGAGVRGSRGREEVGRGRSRKGSMAAAVMATGRPGKAVRR